MQKEINWLLKEKYKGKATKNFYKDIERLNAGEPLDYVIGFAEFLGCKIDLSKKPLIPRPETEFWVEKAIFSIYYDFGSFQNRSITVLDIFSGSGCIGIAVLKHIKNAYVVFADVDKKCLAQIKINLKLNPSLIRANKKILVQSDVFKALKPASAKDFGEARYDYIFANPPYVATNRKNKIQKSVLKHEPHSALFAGKDGLFFINRFLKEAKSHLRPAGKIYMEFDSPQKKEIEKLIKKYGYKNFEFHKDQYDKWRFVIIG